MKYAIWCVLVLADFAALEIRGYDITPRVTHVTIPASVRSSPGGYRSYHFWHSGFQGGK